MPESSFGRQQAVSVIWSEDIFSPRQLFVGLFLQNENLNGGGMDVWMDETYFKWNALPLF